MANASGGGTIQLHEFAREFTLKIYTPGYGDWAVLGHSGNVEATFRCLATLCNPGDSILVEEWTFPSVLATAKPMGLKPVSVKMDGQGMTAADLERVLSTWNENLQGKRPHVMYTVPIGQNPTGAQMGAKRKLAIYDICVRYDIIIIEDDPYYFLQEGAYVPKALRPAKIQSQSEDVDDPEGFIKSLAPSYPKFDYQGRVIRLDSFSKIIAPGSRMGWFTCNPVFAERLDRLGETTTQAPSGFSQAIIIQLVAKQWGMKKFIRWLQDLRGEYTSRRDFIIDTIHELFDVLPSSGTSGESFPESLPSMIAYIKESTISESKDSKVVMNRKTPLFTFIPPTSGMFLWIKFHVGQYTILKPGETLTEHIFINLVKEGLLIAPGTLFSVNELESGEAFGRIAFSNGSREQLLEGLKVLERVMRKYTSGII
ncbi:hypothetical protein Clacol_001212 [Clathrus columnatus]|uniref:Aminotransferase class I/classII large domain-containing protein n=1 Tax=Clathrus columnatus TaxID=1419009 RepID=A0AAV5A2P0_9AGAM|nr:hypothetical protein Clacol_001212 [Clathrus columnatus]